MLGLVCILAAVLGVISASITQLFVHVFAKHGHKKGLAAITMVVASLGA